MKLRNVFLYGAATGLALGTIVANAATIDFTGGTDTVASPLRKNLPNSASISDVTVTAGTFENGTYTAQAENKLVHMNGGLGVDAATGDLRRMENSGARADALKFEFNEAVSLTSISLKHEFVDADFMISSNGTDWVMYDWNGLANWNINTTQVNANNTFSKTWYLSASNTGVNEGFFVSKMDVTAVPLPAAAWLFGSALLGAFGFGTRRRVS